jgi:RecA/RadA recombinase
VHVDVTTRLGAPIKLTPTGFTGLDALLAGGLRPGTVLGIVGAPGSGRTSLALAMAYVAARSQAGVAFATRALDDTEVFARLAARALRRSYPASEVTYGDIWSGTAFRGDQVRRAIGDAVGTVVQKVGAHLHLARLVPGESFAELAARSAPLWARHERVLFFVDDLEGLVTAERGSLDAQLLSLAYQLRELADTGCTVVFTALERHADLVAPGASAMARVVPMRGGAGPQVPLDLRLEKNRLGPVGSVSLTALFGALEFLQGNAADDGQSRPF